MQFELGILHKKLWPACQNDASPLSEVSPESNCPEAGAVRKMPMMVNKPNCEKTRGFLALPSEGFCDPELMEILSKFIKCLDIGSLWVKLGRCRRIEAKALLFRCNPRNLDRCSMWSGQLLT